MDCGKWNEEGGWIFFFFQNNTNFQIILLVSIVSKPFKKLTSQILKTGLYCNNSSITYSIFMKIHVELESVRLKFHKRKLKNQNLKHTNIKNRIRVTRKSKTILVKGQLGSTNIPFTKHGKLRWRPSVVRPSIALYTLLANFGDRSRPREKINKN